MFTLGSYSPIFDELDEENAEKKLKEIQAGLEVDVKTLVKRDQIIDGIHESATEEGADLILMGSDFHKSPWQGLYSSL